MPCITPYTIKNPNAPGTIAVPCGRCPGCRKARAASWAFRLQEEEKRHKKSLFVTLTYDDEHVKGSPNGLLTLDKKDVQNFFKRLRFNTGCKTIKYYACGEYGGRTLRPHYHGILFDADEDAISTAWEAGAAHFGAATINSMNYVTKYICKPKTVGIEENDDRQPEFSLMSKGLGLNYLDPATTKYHTEGMLSYVTLPGGLKQALPRYFRDKLFTEHERAEMNEKMQSIMESNRRKLIQEAGSETEYIRNRNAAIQLAMAKFKSQRYTNRTKI